MRFYNPENFKKGQLLLSRYYSYELAILILSILTSVALIIVVGTVTFGEGKPLLLTILFVGSILPAGLAFLLLNPLEGYHNAYQYFKLKLTFRKVKKKYIWEGVQYDDEE